MKSGQAEILLDRSVEEMLRQAELWGSGNPSGQIRVDSYALSVVKL